MIGFLRHLTIRRLAGFRGTASASRALALLVVCPAAGAATPATVPEENLRVLDFWQIYTDAPNVLYKDIAAEAFARLDERKQAVARLGTKAEWETYRREAREKLLELAGPFPEKTPLNPRALGVVKKDGFRVEKIVYESQPGFFVTAAVFVPEPLRGKAPAIVYCSGHVEPAFRSPAYQRMILNLVKRGFIVLAFDPVNQGERLQFFNASTGRNAIAASGLGHSHATAPTFVLGASLARWMIWDGIRAVDYLTTRDDVDARRLGITGRSGGGTQTAYIAALDERIVAAAMENYITTFEQLLKSRGPQDSEQNFYNAIARGFDQADLLIARAPRPALILATTRDIFSIEGTQAAFAEAGRAYRALGHETALRMSVDDAVHESTRKNREATFAFFQKHLELPGDATDLEVELLTADELRITPTGQLATSLGGETLLSLNRREAARLSEELAARRREPARHLAAVRDAARRLVGYVAPARDVPPPVFSGRYQRDGYAVEKHLLPVDERHAIPLLAMLPQSRAPRGVVLYLHPEGKAAAAQPGGEMEWFVRRGWVVVAPDVVGHGELGPGFLETNDPTHGAFRTWYGYVLMGKSIVGRQMRDVTRTVRFIEERFGVAQGEIAGVARGASGALLLHTAALEGACGRAALLEPLVSYRSLAESERYPLPFLRSSVPHALTAYDLPDLAALLAPRKLLIADVCAGTGARADAASVTREIEVITRAYAGAEGAKLVVFRSGENSSLHDALALWLE